MATQERHSSVQCNVDQQVAWLTLNRPEKHNALDRPMIDALIKNLETLKGSTVRLLILNANGPHFCAGADLAWMKEQASASQQQNRQEAQALAELFRQLDTFPTPTIALIQGNTFGGALGLIACVDVAIAEPNSQYRLSEVSLGLTPATIAPYLNHAIGSRQLRRYALTAESFNGITALQLGLVHLLDNELLAAVEPLIKAIKRNSPEAVSRCKSWLRDVANAELNRELTERSANEIAEVRQLACAREGLSAFFEKRAPNWQEHNDV